MRFIALLMVTLVASMSGSLAYTNHNSSVDVSKMSDELISKLDTQDEIEVIVQLTKNPNDIVWNTLESTGIKLISEMSVLHGGLIVGTPSEMSRLSTFSMVKHM